MNDKREGKGIYYYYNGDRVMGNYHKSEEVGEHVFLKNNGDYGKINY